MSATLDSSVATPPAPTQARTWWALLKQAGTAWSDDYAPSMGAALSNESFPASDPPAIGSADAGDRTTADEAAENKKPKKSS